MPNGISCAYFAARNHIYGQKENNPFKKGIAGVQSARTIDAVAKTGIVKNPVMAPVSKFFNGAAQIGRKIVYPLIIGSGIYNTVKSDDKVRTGTSQALGISTMYGFEKVVEKGLNKVSNKLYQNARFSNNKFLKASWYVLKGLTFVGASLAGYTVGSKAGETMIDKHRESKEDKNKFPVEEGLKEANIFATMDL